jgi:hypothetical protein
MAKKDADSGKGNASFSDSAVIFEDIFKEASQLMEKRKQGSQPSADRGRKVPERKTPQVQRKLPRPAPTRPHPRNEKAAPVLPPTIIKSGTKSKTGKSASILKIGILLALLLVLGAALLNYFGIVEILPVLVGTKEVAQAPPLKREPAKTPGKAGRTPAKKQPGEKVASAALPAPAVPKKVETPAPANPKQEPAKAGAAAPIVEAHEGGGRQEPPPSVHPVQSKAEGPATTPAAQPAVQEPPPVLPPAAVQQQQAPAPVQPVTPAQPAGQARMQSKQELTGPRVRPPFVQTQPSVKPAAPEAGLGQSRSLQYPYSIYLGSYGTHDQAEKALALYHHDGLAVYWSRVNLGEKGTWYRVFAGYFRSEAEAQNLISKKDLKAEGVKTTKYAVLIGVYASRGEANQKSAALLNLGFPTYVIPEAQAKFRLYSGAFVTKEGADIHAAELASKGVRSQAVER